MFFSYLIKKAKSDPNAFAKLYRLHIDSTYRYIEFRCRNKEEAQDLTSQVWETVLKSIARLESNHPFAFKAWLYTIVRNTIHQHFRFNNNKSTSCFENQENFLVSPENTPFENASQQAEIAQIKTLIQALPPQQQEIILMRFTSGFKNKEISKILNITQKTVASNLSRALETLRKHWKKLQQ